ncbi:MAG: hypothetical protein ACOYMF_05340 [Bacteroidales bacterium]
MYQAKVNGQAIDVENLSLTFRLKNPMFDPNSGMEWSASYPFTLPNTPKNREIFGFPGRLSSKQAFTSDFEFEHFMNGIRLPGDTIRIKQTTSSKIEAYVKIGRSDFISFNKDKLLTELTFTEETYQVSNPSHSKYLFNIFDKSYPDIPFAIFPVLNKGFYSGTNDDLWWNDLNDNPKGPYQNMVYYDELNEIHYNPRVITPFPYVAAIIEKIFSEAGYTISRNFFTEDNELKQTCIFNPNRCIYFEHPVDDDEVKISLQNHLPRIKVLDFFIALRVPFGLDLYFNFYKKEVSMITRDEVLAGTDIIEFGNRASRDLKVYTKDLLVNFSFVMKGDSADTYWGERIKKKSDFFPNPHYIEVAEFVNLPSANQGTIGFVTNEDIYYIFEKNQDTGLLEWQFLSLNLQDYISGTGEDLKVEGEIGPLISENHRFAGFIGAYEPWSWDTPVTSIFGNFENSPNGINAYADFALRLMFRRGIAELENGFTYPYGTSFNSFVTPDPDWEKYTLRWFGPQYPEANSTKGLYSSFYKKWLQWKVDSKQIEFIKLMDALEIMNIDFTKKYRAFEVNLILEEISITITENGIQPAVIKAWTV